MKSNFSFRSALVGGLVAGLLMAGVPVVASVGDAILAGQNNSANQTTNLKGNAEFQNFKITNTRATGVAARFVVKPGNPPFHVSSGVTVPKLNADRVDGVHAAGLLKKKDYDADKDGIVDSADIKVRYADDGGFDTDMGLASTDRIQCVTDSVVLTETTTVIADGALSLQPLAESTLRIYGRTVYSPDGGTSWVTLNGVGVEASPGGLDKDAAVPIHAVKPLAAGSYSFAILPVGPNIQIGDDYQSGYCELTVMALTGLGSTTDVVVNSAGLNDTDRAGD